MKLKKLYSFTNNRQIWRLLPTDSGKMIIEERNTDLKEVYFNCIDMNTGKTIFRNLQLEEKFWVGIETIYKDVIYFHKFAKPDMPGHKGIVAFDIMEKKILWQNDDYTYLLVNDNKIYCYKQNYEGRNFYTVDYQTGEELTDITPETEDINILREGITDKTDYSGYLFPEPFERQNDDEPTKNYFQEFLENNLISGKIEYALKENLLLFNYHEIADNGILKNIFKAVDYLPGKIILEETLNRETKAFVPDSFFVKDDLIFLLKEKEKLLVYSIRH